MEDHLGALGVKVDVDAERMEYSFEASDGYEDTEGVEGGYDGYEHADMHDEYASSDDVHADEAYEGDEYEDVQDDDESEHTEL